MNTSTLPHPTRTVYQRKAQATRKRRQAAGKYVTPAQKAAFSRLLSVGSAGLTTDELQALATHPHLLQRQCDQYAALAAQAESMCTGRVQMPAVGLPTPSAQALCHLYGVTDDDINAIFAPVAEDDIDDRAFWAQGQW